MSQEWNNFQLFHSEKITGNYPMPVMLYCVIIQIIWLDVKVKGI